jgi:multidrug efflux pump subunit AcrB
VIGGLLSSIVLSLVFTPTIHYYLDRIQFGRRKVAAEA